MVQRELNLQLDAELEERRREEQRLAAEVEAHEEAKLGLDEQYNSLQVANHPSSKADRTRRWNGRVARSAVLCTFDELSLIELVARLVQEEVEGKSRKLKKLWAKYKTAQAEIQDLQNEFHREKEVGAGAATPRW